METEVAPVKVKGKKYKIVFCQAKPVTKIVIIVSILLCTLALLVIHSAIVREQARLEAAKAAALAQEQEQNELQDKIDHLGSQEGIVDIAGDELDLHDPDKVIVETE